MKFNEPYLSRIKEEFGIDVSGHDLPAEKYLRYKTTIDAIIKAEKEFSNLSKKEQEEKLKRIFELKKRWNSESGE